jgi:hypothetical protein
VRRYFARKLYLVTHDAGFSDLESRLTEDSIKKISDDN